MLIAVLALIAALQSQMPPPTAQTAPAEPVPAPETAPPEPVAEPTADAPRTRQVCRYVEVPGRRFPARRCRTIPVED